MICQKWTIISLFNLKKKKNNNLVKHISCTNMATLYCSSINGVCTCGGMEETSTICFFFASLVQKYEYSPIPTMAMSIPMMFLEVKGSCKRVYPNARTRHVFRCPSTWYVTGDVFPITRNVLKFTNTAIKHESTINPCIQTTLYWSCLRIRLYHNRSLH